MKHLLNFYIFGYWHIAFCAFALYTGLYFKINDKLDINGSVLIFTATLFIYNFHRYVSASKMTSENSDRYRFIKNNQAYAKYILGISGLISLVTFLAVPSYFQITIIISGLLSIGYILPIIFRKRLRDLGMAKIFLISLVWATLPMLPILETGNELTSIFIFSEHFFFIFALTIPFDVRDQAIDQRAQVSNLANQLGLKKLSFLMIFCLAHSILFAFLLYSNQFYSKASLITIILFYITQYLLTYNLKKRKSELYYLFFLDGLILIKGLIYIFI